MMNFLLFLRFLPVIAIAEVKGVTPAADPHHGDHPETGRQENDVMGWEAPPSTYPGGVKPVAATA
jgi:molybdopterin-containing oxidoreductase family membrane subunit